MLRLSNECLKSIGIGLLPEGGLIFQKLKTKTVTNPNLVTPEFYITRSKIPIGIRYELFPR